MTMLVIEKRNWQTLANAECAKYLNKGDIFLPDGTGFEYKVLYKVMSKANDQYEIHVIVKKL